MKLIWGENHEHIILIAETRAEVAFCEILGHDLTAHRFEETRQGKSIVKAKWTILPDEAGGLK